MSVFNRIVVIIGLAIFVALLVLLLISPLPVIDLVQYNIGLFRDALTTTTFWTWYLAGSIVVIVILLVILFFEVWQRRPKTVRIRAQGRGNARIGLKSVSQTLEYRVTELEGANRVTPKLRSQGNDLAVTLAVDAAPGVNIPALSDQIIDLSVRILEGELGLKIKGRMNLDITSEPARAGSVGMRQSVAPAVASRPEVHPVTSPTTQPQAIVRPTYTAPAPRPAAARESDAYLESLNMHDEPATETEQPEADATTLDQEKHSGPTA